jgi:hypothetical protein
MLVDLGHWHGSSGIKVNGENVRELLDAKRPNGAVRHLRDDERTSVFEMISISVYALVSHPDFR